MDVATVPTVRWLLSVDLFSLLFLVLFIAVLTRLSGARRAPAEWWSVASKHTLSHLSTLFSVSSTLAVSSLRGFLHRRAGIVWWRRP